MKDERIKEYAVNGGDLFIVNKIDSYRDGGTGIIGTSKQDYFVHKDNHTLHSSYPPNDDNIIKDELLIEYLIYRTLIYTDRQFDACVRNNKFISEIRFKNKINHE